jgi:hypothetical protein
MNAHDVTGHAAALARVERGLRMLARGGRPSGGCPFEEARALMVRLRNDPNGDDVLRRLADAIGRTLPNAIDELEAASVEAECLTMLGAAERVRELDMRRRLPAFRTLGRHQDALNLLRDARWFYGDTLAHLHDLDMAALLMALDRPAEAAGLAEIVVAAPAVDPLARARAAETLARARLALGDGAATLKACRLAIALWAEAGRSRGEAETAAARLNELAGDAASADGEVEEARIRFTAAHAHHGRTAPGGEDALRVARKLAAAHTSAGAHGLGERVMEETVRPQMRQQAARGSHLRLVS